MRLLEIEVRNWRGLSLKLVGLSPRLNLILGPNESGKSRLFQAIRYGLFESHKGAAQHKQLLQSWTSVEAPFVRVVFADGPVEFEIQKQFLKGASAQLTGGGKTLSGEDAEESLRNIVGARQAGNRGAGTAELGIWPLLMVSQGESRKALQEDLNDDGRSRLQERLSKEIGVAAISAAGQRLMALAEQEYSRYFTASGQDARILREARAELEAARTAFAVASEALQRQEQTATSLADRRRDLSTLELRAQSAKRDAEAARVKSDAARVAEGRVGLSQGVLNTATQRASNVETNLNTRIEADGAVERLTRDLTDVESQLDQRTTSQKDLEQELQAADQLAVNAEESVRNARASADTAQRERRRLELNESHNDLSNRIATLERVERDIAEARTKRATLTMIDSPCLVRLQELDLAARAAAARLQGAAVSVVVHLLQSATVDGGSHRAGESVRIEVVENRQIAIGDLANVEIRPGGGDLDRLREARVKADNDMAGAFRAVGAENLDHAATIHAELTALDQRIGELGREVKATSSKSLGQLREDLVRVNSELERMGSVKQVDGDETSLSAVLAAADDALTSARGARDRANAALSEFRSGTSGLAANAEVTRNVRDRLVRLFANRPTAEVLRSEQREAVAERGHAQTSLASAQQAFADLGGAEVQSDAQRSAQAAEGLVSRVRDARSAVDQLQGTLQGMMEAGNYDTVQQAGAHLEQVQDEQSRIERQARAAKRLWQVLGEERRRVVERLIAPVTLRVKPYLQDLFPGSTLDAGEGLEVVGLQSGNLKEPFAELSGGAQEQISLLTRIGIAEVLAGDGTLPLVLDDALINTDPERIQRVHRALFRAADKLQVIVFSCHDVLFDGLGAEFVVKLEKSRYGVRGG